MTTDNGRDIKTGRFTKGNKLSKNGGRPRKPTIERHYINAFYQAISEDDWKEACEAVLKKAMEGNITAWKALCQYAQCRPVQHITVDAEVTTLSLKEWRELAKQRRAEVESLD